MSWQVAERTRRFWICVVVVFIWGRVVGDRLACGCLL